MAWLRSLRSGLSALLHPARANRELGEELDAYLQFLVEGKIRAGMPSGEALRAAKLEMGGLEALKQQVHRARWESRVQALWLDLRHSLRMLRKTPGFTVIAIISLALGVGANTSIFTLIHALLLKSLPVRQPDQLVSFGQAGGGGIIGIVPMGTGGLFAYSFYRQIEKEHEFFSGICASSSYTIPASVSLAKTSAGPAGTAFFQMVSGNYFHVLGVVPSLGRPILDRDEDAPGRSAVVVLSYHYWLTNMPGDLSVIGRTITIDEMPFTVIGVAPPKFYGDKLEEQAPDFWLPLTMQEQVMQHSSLLAPRDMYWLHIIGRRNENANPALAQDWLNRRVRLYMSDLWGTNLTPARREELQRVSVPLLPAGRGISSLRQQYTEPLEILMGVVVLVLLIACANLASLLLAKVVSREREISTRLALGSSRLRIVSQILTETLLLSLLGGASGLVLAFWGTRALIHFVTQDSTYTALDPKPDFAVLAFTFGVSAATAVLFALAPAFRVSRANVSLLHANARPEGSGGSGSGRLISKILVAAQVVFSLMLLAVAGLFLRSLSNLENRDWGLEHRHLLMLAFLPETAGYKPPQLPGFYEHLLERVEALPGVRSAALSGSPVIAAGNWGSPITIQQYATLQSKSPETLLDAITPGYFGTVGIPILSGRSIGPQDTASSLKVAIINQTFADWFFPHGDAIGRSFTIADSGAPGIWQIVGVARNAMYSGPREPSQPMAYLPAVQIAGRAAYAHWLVVDPAGDPSRVSEELRRTIAQINPNLPVLKMETIHQQVEQLTNHERLLSQLCSWFALLALLLVSIGLYGVVAYGVTRRTGEIGVRMALGAQKIRVIWMVLKESLLLFAAGVLLGIPATLAAVRTLRSQLFDLSPFDPLILLGSISLLAAVILMAAVIPALRAARIDPVVALRYE